MTAISTVGYTEEQKAEIELQLERLLTNLHFANSKRFPSFLRFVVREELAGRGELLKERTLGVEVFGRDASYDTTSDPIVRVTAAEIRKRIAQYYQEAGGAELRISLPPGSYVPHFEWPREHALPESTIPHTDRLTDQPLEAPAPYRRPWLLPVVAGLLCVVALAAFLTFRPRASALDSFWAPVLNSVDPVVVCFPQSRLTGVTLRDAADPGTVHELPEGQRAVIVDDLRPLVSLSGLMELRHQRYVLAGADTTTLTDLRQGPAIFLGAFDNPWTLRMTRDLRFRFDNDPEMKHFWIEDTQSPTHTRWTIDRNQQEATNNYRDYAIVARYQDPATGKIAIIAAGIANGGTVAAGEFLTQSSNLALLRNWDGRNMEAVLSTEIIDGKSAPPKLEALHFW